MRGIIRITTSKYKCPNCKSEHDNEDEANLCLYSHHGLSTKDNAKSLEIIKRHKELLDKAKRATWEVGYQNNSKNRENESKIYRELLNFESEHGIRY